MADLRLRQVERAQEVVRSRGARDDHRVERARAVALERVADGSERRLRPLVRGRELIRVEPHVELGDVEAEHLDAPAQIRQRAIGDACAAIGPQARVHQLEIGEQLARVGVARLGRAVEQVVEAVADEAQLAPVRLVEVLIADLGRERGQLVLVALDRGRQLIAHGHHARRHADRSRQLAHLDAVARERQTARPLEPLGDRVGPGLGVAVLVTADPGAEAQR